MLRFDCALRRRIFPFSPQRIIWLVPCRSPRPRATGATYLPYAPRVPQTRLLVWTLVVAPGLGTQSDELPSRASSVVDQRRFAATVDVDGRHLNVAYTDSDNLAMFVLSHPGACIISPQEAVDAFNRRLNAATQFNRPMNPLATTTRAVISPEINQQQHG